MPRSSATVRCTKKLTGPRKLLGPWTTTWNKQYLSAVHPLTCSLLWVWCLCDPLQVWGFGRKWPWMETFHKFLSKICVSLTIQQLWPNLAKIGCCEVAEKSSGIADKNTLASETLFSPPFRPHLADRALNVVNVVGPWSVHVHRLWSKSAVVCRTYSGKSPKKSIFNIGFQPTMKSVHWPLMGVHLVQRGEAWVGCGPAHAGPSLLYQM